MNDIFTSKRLRQLLYIVTAIGTPLVAYLNSKGWIGDLEVGLWSAEVTVATGLATIKASDPDDTPTDVYTPEHAASE